MKYLLTIIIPAYNSSIYLIPLLRKINSIITPNIQVCVIDDGSADGTREKIRKINLSKNISVFFNQHKGVSAARNYGIKVAKGKYITFLDSDDTINNNSIDTILDNLKNNFDVLILDSFLSADMAIYKQKEYKYLFIGYRNNKLLVSPGIHSKFYKLELLKKNNILFDEKMIIGEDVLFNISSILKAKSVYLFNVNFYNYQRPHTINKFTDMYLENELRYQNNLEKILHNFEDKNYVISYYKINGAISLIENFYGKKKFDFSLVNNARTVLKTNHYFEYLENSKFDNILISRKKKLLKRLLMKKKVMKSIIFDKIIDYLKNKVVDYGIKL